MLNRYFYERYTDERTCNLLQAMPDAVALPE